MLASGRVEIFGIDQPHREAAGRRRQMVCVEAMLAKRAVGYPSVDFTDHGGAVSDAVAGKPRGGENPGTGGADPGRRHAEPSA